jgi:MFS family permease
MNASTKKSEPSLWDPTFGWFLAFFFLLNINLGAFPPLLPQIMGDLDLSFSAAGALGSAFAITRFLIDLPAGLFADRIGAARLLHGASGLLLAGTALSVFAASFWSMFLARLLQGVGSGAAMVFSILYLMRSGAAAQRNRRANLYELGVIAGMAVSSDLAGRIAGLWGWRWSFVVATGATLLTWLVAAFGVLPGVRDLFRESPAPAPSAIREEPILRPAVLVAIYLLSFGQAFAWGGGISTLLPLYGGKGLDLAPEVIGRTMAIAFWIEVALLFPVGWAADVWGKLRVAIPGFLAMLIGTLLVPWMTGTLGYGLAFACLVSGMSVWMSVPALLAERMGSGFRGKAAGYYRLVTDFGFVVAPAAVGWLIDDFGFAAGAISIAAVVAASILCALCFLRREP